MKSRRQGIRLGLIAVLALAGCHRASEPQKKIEPTYDKQTGRLELLKYDADGDGIYDTFCYMDGAKFVRIEVDKNEDGKIDRWEYYTPDQKIEKMGFSTRQDGVEDAWSYFNPAGALDRIEISTKRDRKIDRVEYYDSHGVLARAEEDTDGDGKIDKWETYDGIRVASVAFDTQHRGTPDRRLIYGVDGSVRLEVDEKGTGTFVPVTAPPAAPTARTPRPQ